MLKKIKDWIGSNLDVYKVESASDVGAGLYRHVWKGRENATQIGTTLNAEIMNNLQNSLVHSINATKTTGTGTDYYVCNLEGLTEFGLNNDLKLRINVDTENTNETTKLRLNGIDYTLLKEHSGTLKQIEAGDFKPNKSYELVFNGSQFIVTNITEYGSQKGTALEGNRLAEIIGLEFGGNIQDTGAKVTGKFYYDKALKYYYECIANNSLTYNDSSKFRAISNKPISDRLENLYRNLSVKTYTIPEGLTVGVIYKIGKICIIMVDSNTRFNGTNYGITLFNIPAEFRPINTVPVSVGFSNSTVSGAIHIENNGNVVWRGNNNASGAMYFNAAYLSN